MRLFFFFSILTRYFAQVARALHAQHPPLQLSGVVYNRTLEREVRQAAPVAWQYLGVFTRFRESTEPGAPMDLDYLRRCESAYALPNLPLMVYGDRFASELPRAKQLRLLQSAARFLEEALDQAQPDVIISEGIDCLLSYLLYGMARQHGVPFYAIASRRLAGRLTFISNHEDRWERVETIYRQLDHLSVTQRERAQAFVAEFRRRRPATTQVRYPRHFSWQLANLRALPAALHARLSDRYDYLYASPARLAHSRLQRLARTAVADRMVFELPRPGERYVLFPLQFQPESTTLVLAPYYLDQAPLVENLARSLPIGVWLYVKEHPASVGRRPLAFYNRLRKLTNVRLISPYVDSHSLIPGAGAVATISSTMGFEAIMYGRPVLTFGNAFFNLYDQVYRVHDIYRLPWQMKEALEAFRPDEELLLRFATALLEGTYPGEAIYPSDSPTPDQWRKSVLLTARAITEQLGLGPGQHAPGSSAGRAETGRAVVPAGWEGPRNC